MTLPHQCQGLFPISTGCYAYEENFTMPTQPAKARENNICHDVSASVTMANTGAQTNSWSLCKMKDCMAS